MSNEKLGPLVREIVIYTLVVACIVVILGLSYLVQIYRKKSKEELPTSNTVQNSQFTERHHSVNSGLSGYDEIDETMLLENVNINKELIGNTPNANGIQINTDNANYLHPIHLDEEKSSSSVSDKSLTRSYLSFHESDQCYDSGGSDKDDDTTSYLHPYHSSNGDTDSSHSSNKIDSDGYLKPYQPVTEGSKQTSHSYEASVTVHTCQQTLSVPSSDEEPSHKIHE